MPETTPKLNKTEEVIKAFPRKTAGHVLTENFPKVFVGSTVKDIEDLLLKKTALFETIDYVYVVDREGVLRGVVSIKELFRTPKNLPVDEVMKKELVVAHPFTHQERIVYLALKHNLKEIPVVDDLKKLIGIVTYDTILSIFNEEMHEDMLQFGGIYHKVENGFMSLNAPAGLMVKNRLPWLVVGVVGGVFTATIVSSFEETLENLPALAAFIPVLAYLSDAAGTQSETLSVRTMALDPKISFKKYFSREFIVALILALVCGLLLAFAAAIIWNKPILGLIVGTSMFLSIFAAVFISTSLPFLFKKLRLDPALGSGPIATMISDISTITIYFLIASSMLKYAPL